MDRLHVSRKVERTLARLRQSGKLGRMAAKRAERIIESIQAGELASWIDAKSKCTLFGEKRIRNCRKFDLGFGYRLIVIQRGDTLIMPFLGPHDDSRRWLESNSGLKDFPEGEGTGYRIEPKAGLSNQTSDEEAQLPDTEEMEFFDNVSQEELREVFQGLIDSAKKGPLLS